MVCLPTKSDLRKTTDAYVDVEDLFRALFPPKKAYVFQVGPYGSRFVVFGDDMEEAFEEMGQVVSDNAPGLGTPLSDFDEEQQEQFEKEGYIDDYMLMEASAPNGQPFFLAGWEVFAKEHSLKSDEGKLEAKKALIALRTGSPALYAEYVEDNDGHDPLRDKTYG